jgi:hypothetical protein
MSRKTGAVRLKLHIKEDLTPLLKRVGLNMRSPQVSTIIQQGAELIAEEARRRAPVGPTGNLRAGIYTASTLRNNFRQLTRRGQRRVNEPLKYIRRGTVLVVSSTFYGRWVEKGRQSRSKYDVLRPGEKMTKRTVGRQFATRKRGKPFFRPAIRAKKAEAERHIDRALNQLIEKHLNR